MYVVGGIWLLLVVLVILLVLALLLLLLWVRERVRVVVLRRCFVGAWSHILLPRRRSRV